MVVDPGSVGNLCGDRWAKLVAQTAAKNGRKPTYDKRPRPLNVSGVGHGSQAAAYDCTLPIALKHAEGTTVSIGTVKTPTVSNSDLPGLLGLQALRRNRAIIDFSSLKIYFAGPGEYNLDKAMPPGTDVFQTELAPSGHMVIPCCEYIPGLPQQVEALCRCCPGISQARRLRRSQGRAPLLAPPSATSDRVPVKASQTLRNQLRVLEVSWLKGLSRFL